MLEEFIAGEIRLWRKDTVRGKSFPHMRLNFMLSSGPVTHWEREHLTEKLSLSSVINWDWNKIKVKDFW